MKISLNLSVEDAQQLLRILHDFRHALSANADSMRWVIPGVSSISFDISQIILMEDVQIQIHSAVEDAHDVSHFAGCCRTF